MESYWIKRMREHGIRVVTEVRRHSQYDRYLVEVVKAKVGDYEIEDGLPGDQDTAAFVVHNTLVRQGYLPPFDAPPAEVTRKKVILALRKAGLGRWHLVDGQRVAGSEIINTSWGFGLRWAGRGPDRGAEMLQVLQEAGLGELILDTVQPGRMLIRVAAKW